MYGNVGIFLVDRCTVLSFCRRLGRKRILERAMDHSHRKKGLEDSFRGQLTAHVSNHAKFLEAVSNLGSMGYWGSPSFHPEGSSPQDSWHEQRMTVSKEHQRKRRSQNVPCFPPFLKSFVEPSRKLLESNASQAFPLHTLPSSSLAPVMALQAAFEVK